MLNKINWSEDLKTLAAIIVFAVFVVMLSNVWPKVSSAHYVDGFAEITVDGQGACVVDNDGFSHCALFRSNQR